MITPRHLPQPITRDPLFLLTAPCNPPTGARLHTRAQSCGLWAEVLLEKSAHHHHLLARIYGTEKIFWPILLLQPADSRPELYTARHLTAYEGLCHDVWRIVTAGVLKRSFTAMSTIQGSVNFECVEHSPEGGAVALSGYRYGWQMKQSVSGSARRISSFTGLNRCPCISCCPARRARSMRSRTYPGRCWAGLAAITTFFAEIARNEVGVAVVPGLGVRCSGSYSTLFRLHHDNFLEKATARMDSCWYRRRVARDGLSLLRTRGFVRPRDRWVANGGWRSRRSRQTHVWCQVSVGSSAWTNLSPRSRFREFAPYENP